MELPIKLNCKSFRFVKIHLKDKRPFEYDWQNSSNYSYDSSQIKTWQGNIGVATGYGNLVVLDFDSKEYENKLKPMLPPTFTVKTGSGGSHYYYFCDDTKSFKVLDKDKNTLVDVQGKGKQVVAPGSTHPNGNKYEVVADVPIATIKYSFIEQIFAEHLNKKSKEMQNSDQLVTEIKRRISLHSLLSEYSYDLTSSPTMCNLGHSSKGGKCFSYSEDLWHCFHCDKGGDIFSFIQEHENLSFIDTLTFLRKKAGIEETIIDLGFHDVQEEYVGKLVRMKGILRSKTQIKPTILFKGYVCKVCSKRYEFKEGTCCNSQLGYKQIVNDRVQAVLEEETVTSGNITNKIIIEFSRELKTVSEEILLGDKYVITGKLNLRKKSADTYYYFIHCSTWKNIKEGSIAGIKIQDEEKIKVLVQQENFLPRLRQSVFGTDIYGLELIQESILLQMVSSPKEKILKNHLKDRGNIMLLFVGSPGCGKSMLLKRTAEYFPKSRYATGSGATAIGLLAAVLKDEDIGDYVLTPGAVALCHPYGIASLDEIDKVDKKDMTKLNTMMDSLKIPIDKANLHKTLPADVSILAAMNPKHGVFEPNESVYSQIDLTKDFKDRFDLIFNIDYYSKRNETDVVKSMLGVDKEEEEMMDISLTHQFFALARTIDPVLSGGAKHHLIEEYEKICTSASGSEAYFSRRLATNLVRLCKAYARLRLSKEVDFTDIKQAKELLLESFKSLGIYSESGGANIELLENIVPKTKREKMTKIISVLKRNQSGMAIEQLRLDLDDTLDFDEILEKMHRDGEIWYPRPGFVKFNNGGT